MRSEVEAMMIESAIEDDDQGFYDDVREDVIEATAWMVEDEDVAAILTELGFSIVSVN